MATTKYLVFDTEEEALAAETNICNNKNYPAVGVNARTGEPQPQKQQTVRWALPQLTTTGVWVIPCATGEFGIDPDPEWFNYPEEDLLGESPAPAPAPA